MQTLISREEPLSYSLKMDAEVSGFLGPNEKHSYVEVLPMGRYELEILQSTDAELVVVDQFNDLVGEVRAYEEDTIGFYVPGRELIFVEIRNPTNADVYYSFRLRRNPRQLMIYQAYSA